MVRRAGVFFLVFVAVAGNAPAGVRHRTTGGKSVNMGQVKKDPAKEIEKQRKASQREADAARKLMAEKRWGEALKTLNRAHQLSVNRRQAAGLRPLFTQIEREGQRQLLEARQAYESGRYVEAVKAFEVIGRTFGRLPSGRTARGALKLARSDPAVQAAIQESKAKVLDDRIARILGGSGGRRSQPSTQPTTAPSRVSVIKQLKLDKQVKAVDLLAQIVKMYGDCPTGQRAAADLKALQADETFTSRLERCRQGLRARNALKRAQRYHKAGLRPKAIQCYNDVIRDFPGTSEAIEAEAALSVIQIETR